MPDGALRTPADLQEGAGSGGAFEKVVAGFSRYHKYTLGAELRNQSRGVVTAIVKANAQLDKRDSLLALRDRLEELTLLVRLGKEVGAFRSLKSYQYVVEEVVSISRQNEGWIRRVSAKSQGGQNRRASSGASARTG